MSVKDSVREFLTQNAFFSGILPDQFADDFPLLDSGILDSLGVFTLVGFLEKTYSIKIEVDDLSRGSFGTLTEIETLVTHKMVHGRS